MRVVNRRAKFDYEIKDKIEAGIVLTGAEVKSVKGEKIKLEGAHVKIIDGEAYLVNSEISPYAYADNREYDPKRTRKLLLKKKQITALLTKIKSGALTLVALACYTIGRRGIIKIEVGIARGKKKWDKREAIKRKDREREMERELRGKDRGV